MRADTVNALAAGTDARTAGRMAELIARRYMMMIIFEKFFSWWYFKGRGMLDVFEGLLNWWYDCW